MARRSRRSSSISTPRSSPSLGVAPQTVFDSLAKQNAVTAAGTFETGGQHIPLRVTGALDGVEAVKATPVSTNGVTFRLGDIATVTAGYADPPSFLVRQDGEPALGVGVVMAKGANIISFGKEVKAALAAHAATMPVGIDVTQIADQPTVVDNAVFEFLRSFAEALVIVLGVSFVSLGWRTGVVVATSVPLVLAVVSSRHERARHGSQPHHARRLDHRARPPGR